MVNTEISRSVPSREHQMETVKEVAEMWDKESSSSIGEKSIDSNIGGTAKKSMVDVHKTLTTPNLTVIEPEDFDEPQILISFRDEL